MAFLNTFISISMKPKLDEIGIKMFSHQYSDKLIDWLISSMMRVIQVPVGVSQNISIESHFASAAACSSALGEFIVLRVEHWMTDSCPSWQQKTQKSSSSQTWLWPPSSSGLCSASLRVRTSCFCPVKIIWSVSEFHLSISCPVFLLSPQALLDKMWSWLSQQPNHCSSVKLFLLTVRPADKLLTTLVLNTTWPGTIRNLEKLQKLSSTQQQQDSPESHPDSVEVEQGMELTSLWPSVEFRLKTQEFTTVRVITGSTVTVHTVKKSRTKTSLSWRGTDPTQ